MFGFKHSLQQCWPRVFFGMLLQACQHLLLEGFCHSSCQNCSSSASLDGEHQCAVSVIPEMLYWVQVQILAGPLQNFPGDTCVLLLVGLLGVVIVLKCKPPSHHLNMRAFLEKIFFLPPWFSFVVFLSILTSLLFPVAEKRMLSA